MKKFFSLLAFASVLLIGCKPNSNEGPVDPDSGKEVVVWSNNGANPDWSSDQHVQSGDYWADAYIYTWFDQATIDENEADASYLGLFRISIYEWTEGDGKYEANYFKTFDLSKYSSATFTFDWARFKYGPEDLDTILAKGETGDYEAVKVPVACPVITDASTIPSCLVNCGKIDLTKFCGGKVTLCIRSKTMDDGTAGTSLWRNFELKGVVK